MTTIHDEAFNDPDPLPLSLDVDLDRLGWLLRQIEATADARGWGAGMSVYLVYDNTIREVAEHFDRMCGVNPRMGRTLRLGPYRARRFAHPAMFRAPGKRDFEVLRTFAVNLAYGDADRAALMRSALRVPSVLALACQNEVLGRHQTVGELATNKDADVDWATLSDSYEC